MLWERIALLGPFILIGSFLLWMIVFCVVGDAAYRKGLSLVWWIVLGMIAGPLAILLVIATPANQEELDKRAVRREWKRWCPYCREAVLIQAVYCRHCQNVLKPRRAEWTASKVVESENEEIEEMEERQRRREVMDEKRKFTIGSLRGL